MKAIGVTCLYSWNSSTSCSLENPLLLVNWVQPRVWSKFSVIQTHNSSSLLALEALSGDRFFVVERMRFSSDRSICSVSIPICGWGSYIFPFVFLQAYFGILTILYAHFITHFDVSRPQGSAAALDGPSARYGYGVSRIWTLRVLWPVSKRPDSGRLVCSGRLWGVQSESVWSLRMRCRE